MRSVSLFGVDFRVDFRGVHTQGISMNHPAKLIVKVKLPLTKRSVDALESEDLHGIAWDDNPASDRTEARSLSRLGDALEDYIVSGHVQVTRFQLTRSRAAG